MRHLVAPFFANSLLSKTTPTDWFGEMDRFFGDVANESAFEGKGFFPLCEVTETDHEYKMSFDLPGLKKDEIKIELKDNLLSVYGERKREKAEETKEKVQRYEKSYGYFRRSFSLPANAIGDKVSAKYENGVLELSLPKAELTKPKTIEVL